MRQSHVLLTTALGALLLAASASAATRKSPPPIAKSTPPVTQRDEAPAFDVRDLDPTCQPCKDFYQYATGGWQKRNVIPGDHSEWGSFDEVQERNLVVLHKLVDRMAADRTAAEGSATQRVGGLYASCMDSASAEAAGAQPLAPMLAAIDAMKSPSDVARQAGWLHAHSTPAVFGFGAGPDPKRSTIYIASAGQGGLGLPDRDYYLNPDSSSAKMRADYVAHVSRMLALIGRTDASAEAAAVMAIETALAKASMTNVQRRDPKATYHKVPLDTLRAWAPGVDWTAYFSVRGMKEPDSVNVQQPDFFRAVSGMTNSVSIADWQAYLRWHVVSDAAMLLSTAFVNEKFAFNQKLSGQPELEPRWKRCLEMTDGLLGDLLGQEYVKVAFPPAARDRALKLVRNLESALGDRIAALDWMSDTTKVQAKVKLEAFANKIGYPDTWRDYAGVQIHRERLVDNALACSQWAVHRNVSRIGQAVDKGEWSMTPPTVNAYYSGSFNSINFPAGILEPPFYDPTWDDALIYGAIGVVIGHEMTHGFDDRGRQFDSNGNLRDWWTAADANRYKERAAKVATQFDSYTIGDGVHVNGKLTLGENIADLGGVAVAYAALQKALEGKPRTKIDGFTPEQRFFLAHARVWHDLYHLEGMVTQVKTDPHSPPQFRVNGPLSNLPEFAGAFGCKDGDAMVRKQEERARIW
jgi:putative endopeptidase